MSEPTDAEIDEVLAGDFGKLNDEDHDAGCPECGRDDDALRVAFRRGVAWLEARKAHA